MRSVCTMGVLLVAITVAAIAANAEGRERFACSTFEWGRVCRYWHLMTAANADTAASQRMRVRQFPQKLNVEMVAVEAACNDHICHRHGRQQHVPGAHKWDFATSATQSRR